MISTPSRLLSGTTFVALCLGLGLAFSTTPLEAEDEALPENFDAIALNVGAGPRGSARLQIRVTRWSTEEDRAVLIEALKAGTRMGLPDALNDQDPAGSVRESRTTPATMRYTRNMLRPDGSRQVIMASDRPLAFLEAWTGGNSRNYNVTLVILNLDAEGQGDGQIIVGGELSWDEEAGRVSVTSASAQPVQLTSVRQR